ncbi:MAG: gliding motility-associated C-terminal domain-containing protein [Saprospiraceae bacterium]|nr:gliding motility-associated C-terminal domain-containing protein [Saprospiraceae bacterium]
MRQKLFFALTLLFFISDDRDLFAAHIIGGEMYYECLGYGSNGADTTRRRYLITIKLYRDCASSGANFDNPLGFTIFRQQGNSWVNTRSGQGANSEYRVNLQQPVSQIDPPQYPCLILPPNICGEAGTYQLEVELPIISSKYLVVWQRCCRNNTITNIVDPESTGATYFIEIHPEAQRTCNSSPRFINFPPTVLCVNAPFNFDHSAFDSEGDQLVYEFCEPLTGGGRVGGNNCQSVIPTPDCIPPYTPVQYRFPYTALFPLGGNPQVTINTLNGIITGTPDAIGQFVVGVCVYEYRNGVLLSVLKRDFQFNVASCEGAVEAMLGGASRLTPDFFSITVCGSLDYQMQNASIDSRFINEVQWIYENGGSLDTFFGWAPRITFKEGGWHEGRFILNPGTNCGDTGFFRINLVPDLNANFEFVYDSCVAGPVQFTDLSSSQYSQLSQWNWSLGDGITAFSQNPIVNYLRPGTYPVLLTVKDNFGCQEQFFKQIKWYPSPNVVIFSPNKNEGCIPLDIEFKNISFPTDSSYRFIWRFSDGVVDSGYLVNHIFRQAGSYGLKLEVTSPLGCYTENDFSNVIQAFDPPFANWAIDRMMVNLNDPVIHLDDLTTGTIGRTWIIQNNKYYYDKNLTYELQDTGYHSIQLIAVDRFLCTDTLQATVFAFRDFSLYMPNAFTPNGDGKNEEFGPVGQFAAMQYYSMAIYDRWGSLMFSTTNPSDSWNGKYQNTGKEIPPGVYIYELKYKALAREPVETRNTFSLIR